MVRYLHPAFQLRVTWWLYLCSVVSIVGFPVLGLASFATWPTTITPWYEQLFSPASTEAAYLAPFYVSRHDLGYSIIIVVCAIVPALVHRYALFLCPQSRGRREAPFWAARFVVVMLWLWPFFLLLSDTRVAWGGACMEYARFSIWEYVGFNLAMVVVVLLHRPSRGFRTPANHPATASRLSSTL